LGLDPLSLRLTEALAKNGVVDLGTGDIAISKDQRKLITDGDDLEAKIASSLQVSPAGGAGEDDGESGELSGGRLHQ
jgi:isopentenyl phosphate kinase